MINGMAHQSKALVELVVVVVVVVVVEIAVNEISH